MSDDTCTPPVYANPMPVTIEQQMLREALAPLAEQPTVADLADVPIWRYNPSPDECDHPVTVTKRLDIAQPIPGDPNGRLRVIGQTTDAVTACLTCHHLAPAREDPQP